MKSSLFNSIIGTINGYKSNQIIMKFVIDCALEKLALDVSEKTGTTQNNETALLLLTSKDATIVSRFNAYVNTGLLGCYLAAASKAGVSLSADDIEALTLELSTWEAYETRSTTVH